MAVESATYVNQLNETLPTNTDPISEGDNHLRLIKQVLKNTFPNIGGQVTLSDSDLNNAAIRAAALTSGALVKADASGKLTSSYAEADVPRRNQAETITGGWTFDTGGTRFRDQGAAAGPVVEIVGDDQALWALEIKNATYGGNGLGLQQQDAGDFVLQLRDSTNANTASLTLKQDGSAQFSGRLDAATVYENNLRVLAQMNSGRLIGRTSAGAGQWEEISTGSGLSLSAGVLDTKVKFATVSTASLTLGTVYQNTTGSPMLVMVSSDGSTTPGSLRGRIGATSSPSTVAGMLSTIGSMCFVVPAGWYYAVDTLPGENTPSPIYFVRVY